MANTWPRPVQSPKERCCFSCHYYSPGIKTRILAPWWLDELPVLGQVQAINIRLGCFLWRMLILYFEPPPISTSPETHEVGENDTLGPMFQVFLIDSEVHLDSLLFTTGHRFWHTDNSEKTLAGAVEWTYEMRGFLVTQINCPRLSIQILMQNTCLVRKNKQTNNRLFL